MAAGDSSSMPFATILQTAGICPPIERGLVVFLMYTYRMSRKFEDMGELYYFAKYGKKICKEVKVGADNVALFSSVGIILPKASSVIALHYLRYQ